MVKLHIKKGDESQFLYETTVQISIDDLIADVVPIYNGRLKVNRLCAGRQCSPHCRIPFTFITCYWANSTLIATGSL